MIGVFGDGACVVGVHVEVGIRPPCKASEVRPRGSRFPQLEGCGF